MKPVTIKVLGKENLYIKWDDGAESLLTLKNLRRNCPCATCSSSREEQSKNYIPLYFKDQITIVKLQEVGNYAISVSWKDGHNTGIYEFPYLRKLAEN